MDATLSELAKQIPSLLVLCWMLREFLKAMSKRDDVLKEISEQWKKSQEDAVAVVKENSVVLGKTAHVMDSVLSYLAANK